MIDDIREVVLSTYALELGGTHVADDMDLFENGLIDSFALINLVNELERRYQIRIPDSDATAANLASIEKATRYMRVRLGA